MGDGPTQFADACAAVQQDPSDAWVVVQVLICGAELFTSNAALMPVAYYEKKASLVQVSSPAPLTTITTPCLCTVSVIGVDMHARPQCSVLSTC